MKQNKYNKIKFLILSFIIAVIFARISGTYFNTDPVVGGFEFHHLDYGFLLLIVTLLFINPKKEFFYILLGVSLGLIIDEIYYFRINFAESANNYSSTILPTAIISVLVIAVLIILNKSLKKHVYKIS